ncbi:hypothetical protein PSAL_006120 [Pseudooceanicola algae]|uniref:Uncharacterized protein n=1 Tax=Pseudooceanicola algae TaxID=1537215 RepID=A0A418SDH9_9RHOB|nr:hypothetical protein PSAL_006120 [Pseudooceanicola algae]
MSGYQRYAALSYTPAYGCVDMRGEYRTFSAEVSIEQGLAMEADGIPVMWVHSSCPAWAGRFARLWMRAQRLLTWPSRAG